MDVRPLRIGYLACFITRIAVNSIIIFLVATVLFENSRREILFTNKPVVNVVTKKPFQNHEEPLIKTIERVSAEMGVNPVVTLAIINHESHFKVDAIRFEPKVYNRLKEENDGVRRMIASSHGLMQIMGFHTTATCGLKSWSELYDPEKNIRCGLTILINYSKKHKHLNPKDKLKATLKSYNGGGSVADTYSKNVSAKIINSLDNENWIL